MSAHTKVLFCLIGLLWIPVIAMACSQPAAALEELSIPDGNVQGYDQVVEIKVPWLSEVFSTMVVEAESGSNVSYEISGVRFDAAKKNAVIRLAGSGFQNGTIYRIRITFYKKTDAGMVPISNYAIVYGMPHKPNERLTVGPYGMGASLISIHRDNTVRTRYNIHDYAKAAFVKGIGPAGTGKSGNVTGLTNGRLYYAAARPYKIYSGHYCYGPLTKAVHFVPLTVPEAGKVKVSWSGTASAKFTIPADSAADGISVLARQQGKTIQKGCESSGNSCTVTGLNKNNSYEFYVMKYKTFYSKNYYGSAIRMRHKVDFAGMNAPKNPYVAIGNDKKANITAKLDPSADGISVLVRTGEGAFTQFCDSKSNSCTAAIDTTKRQSFIVMQYKTVDGKKIYSSGITVRNWISSKSAGGFALTDFVVDAVPAYDPGDIYTALPDYMTEEDLLREEIYAALAYDPSAPLTAKDAGIPEEDWFFGGIVEHPQPCAGPEEEANVRFWDLSASKNEIESDGAPALFRLDDGNGGAVLSFPSRD